MTKATTKSPQGRAAGASRIDGSGREPTLRLIGRSRASARPTRAPQLQGQRGPGARCKPGPAAVLALGKKPHSFRAPGYAVDAAVL